MGISILRNKDGSYPDECSRIGDARLYTSEGVVLYCDRDRVIFLMTGLLELSRALDAWDFRVLKGILVSETSSCRRATTCVGGAPEFEGCEFKGAFSVRGVPGRYYARRSPP